MNEWTVVGITYGLAAVVSFLVAVLIHVLGICIKRFAPAEAPVVTDAAAQQGGSATIAPKRDDDAEIAAAIVAVQAYIDKHS